MSKIDNDSHVMAHLLILHGPNLNMLGHREPDYYGNTTLAEINRQLQVDAEQSAHVLSILQTNDEATLIARLHATVQQPVDFIIINPGAWAHTSIALRDALSMTNCPFIEVHISNIFEREPFRHHSYLSDKAIGVITGLGLYGYQAALQAAINYLSN